VLDPSHQEDRMSPTDKPTAKQLSYLRQLAARVGQSFAYPQTRAQASAEIRRLRSAQRGRDAALDRQAERRERSAVQRDLQERASDATRVEPDYEVAGYGANATWR
jgi:hypothetical protein